MTLQPPLPDPAAEFAPTGTVSATAHPLIVFGIVFTVLAALATIPIKSVR